MMHDISEFLEKEDIITEKIIKFGSLVSMLNNKDLSIVMFFNELLKKENIRKCFCLYMDMDFKEVTRELGKRYDILGKSKKILKMDISYDV